MDAYDRGRGVEWSSEVAFKIKGKQLSKKLSCIGIDSE